MNQEIATYIIKYFSQLMTVTEKAAWKHYHSSLKLESAPNYQYAQKAKEIYEKSGWLSTNANVAELLKDGYDKFKLSVAIRILKDHPEEVFINTCPNCGKLARTPQAKQCRFCYEDWH